MSTHPRDGSLLRKKQDQWAREKAEESENIWFPFGSPGGGTPNRKFESIDYTSPLAKNDLQRLSEDQPADCTGKGSIVSESKTQQDTNLRMMKDVENRSNGQSKCQMPQGSSFAPHQLPMAYPIPVQYPYPVPSTGFPNSASANGMQWSYLQPIPINVVPPGTIPIPIQDLSKSIAEGTPICPVAVAEQLAQMASQSACWGPTPPTTVPMAYPIPPSVPHRAPIDPAQQPHTSNVAVVPPLEQSTHEGYESSSCSKGTISRRSTAESKYDSDRHSSVTDYDEQIAEKKRIEAEEAERERYEEKKIEREKEEKARREAELDRRHKEEERLKEQERERIRRTLEEALERAKREAEITRKARVFKHVLEGAEKSPELERRLLGVDPETGDRILQEISQLERHKKLDQESIYKKCNNSGRSETREASPSGIRSKSVQPKSRSQSMSESMMSTKSNTDRRRTVSGKKQTASICPYNSTFDQDAQCASAAQDTHHQSTPIRRAAPGRMSVRVTKKEKENSPVDDFHRSTARSQNRTIDHTPVPSLRDKGMPTSKIPVAKPITNGTKSAPRLDTIPPQPLRHANHRLSESDAEPVQLTKSLSTAFSRPSCLPPSKELLDNPLFSPVATRHRRFKRMRGLSDSPVNVYSAGSSGSTEESNEGNSSSGSVSPQEAAPSPVPAAAVNHDVYATPKAILTSNNNELKIRSALSSPSAYLGPSPRSSSYAMKLLEKGCNVHIEDALAPDVRRKAEANLSRTPSSQSLRGSIGNLAGWRGSISNLAEDAKPNLSRFRSMNPAYRSFNTKRITEKQQEVIDRLSRLRENLRSRENLVERSVLPKRPSNLTSSSAIIKT
ncbi:hypothetical protein RB195_000721 [Necator americanus]